MKDINILYDAINKLEQLERTGWVALGVPAKRLESVADHTLQVVILAVSLQYELKLNFDISKMVQMCFIHDIGESIVGDVADTDIDFNKRKEIEREKTIEFLKSLPESMSIFLELWIECEERKTDLAKFIHQVDKIDAIIKAKKYSEEYNMPELFNEFYNTTVNRGTCSCGPLKEVFEQIKLNDIM